MNLRGGAGRKCRAGALIQKLHVTDKCNQLLRCDTHNKHCKQYKLWIRGPCSRTLIVWYDRVISGTIKGSSDKVGAVSDMTCDLWPLLESFPLWLAVNVWIFHKSWFFAQRRPAAVESSEASNDVVITQRETNWCPSSYCLALKASFVLFIFLPTDTILWNLLSGSLIYILYTDTVYLVVHLFTYTACFIYTSCSGKKKEHICKCTV